MSSSWRLAASQKGRVNSGLRGLGRGLVYSVAMALLLSDMRITYHVVPWETRFLGIFSPILHRRVDSNFDSNPTTARSPAPVPWPVPQHFAYPAARGYKGRASSQW